MPETNAPRRGPFAGADPSEAVFRVVAFLVMLTIYLTVLMVVGWLLPYGVLIGLAAWMIVRRPLSRPHRLDSDLQAFGRQVGDVAEKLARSLVLPLSKDPAPPSTR